MPALCVGRAPGQKPQNTHRKRDREIQQRRQCDRPAHNVCLQLHTITLTMKTMMKEHSTSLPTRTTEPQNR
ncbi:hypothetical protein EYF80_038846 [Liparis tanakae]|uniref:Uncharacterized protein n=1 Tax=Liparis tanakae TaxID=230148 RepID=A0A4Z2GDJ0_9TELE|nr:hypothetical protein EYF80_038846 [Liparis tanakae]